MFFRAADNGSNAWWQYLFGIIIVAMGYVIGQVPLMIVVLLAAARQDDTALVDDFARSMDFSTIGLDPNVGFALALMMFMGALGGLWITIRMIHGRTFGSLINNLGQVRWSRFFWAISVWFILGLIAEGISWFINAEAYTWQFNPSSFFILLFIALLLIPFQASFEELFVRGYLMQGIGLGTGSKVMAMLVTSFLFAGLHLMNPEITQFGMITMVTYYVLVGFFLAFLTVMDDGLELAMGVHTATNLFGSLVITFDGSALQTPALIKLESPDVQIMLLLMVLSASIFILLAGKKYGWTDWNKWKHRLQSNPSNIPLLEDETELNEHA